MFRLLFVIAISTLLLAKALGQDSQAIPEACLEAAENEVEGPGRWKPCFDAAEPQSLPWLLSVINLGTAAIWEDDFETAAYYYRLTISDERTYDSDVILHANRGMVFHRTGDLDLAKRDVEIAWTYVKNGEYGIGDQELELEGRFYVLSLILQPMQETGAEGFGDALAFYKAIETEDVLDRANRAAVLSNVGDIEAAILESAAVIELGLDDSGVYNKSL